MASRPPNILFLFADQFRHDHLGMLGAHPVRTPHLDALAARGALFTQCSTNSPVCAPARISLATGLAPHRLGALDNYAYLPCSRTTLYQRLRDADYRVGVVGKLDLAKHDPYNGIDGQRPAAFRFGFTHPLEVEGKMHAGRGRSPLGPYTAWLAQRGLLDAFCDDYDRRERDGYWRNSRDSVLPTDAFADVYIGQRSVEWLRSQPQDFPWFLGVHFVGPHDPFDPPAAYAARFRDTPVLDPLPRGTAARPSVPARRWRAINPDETRHSRRQYCASISSIDDQIGAILAALDARGEADNTLVVFTADHGEMLGDLDLFTKSVPYEASLRVPLILAGPTVVPGCRSSLIELADLNPTLCQLAGLPTQPDLDAISFAGLLADPAQHHRAECLSTFRTFSLVRTATHKLIETPDGRHELYDLAADPHEQVDLAGTGLDLERQLAHRMMARMYRDCRHRY